MPHDSAVNSLILMKRQSFPEIAAKCKGALAIFMERPTATRVRVSDISFNDWGVTLRITCVPTTGMLQLREQRESCELSAAWEVLSSDTSEWQATYCSWRIIFDPGLIGELTTLASQAVEQGKVLDYTTAAVCVAKHDARKWNRLFSV